MRTSHPGIFIIFCCLLLPVYCLRAAPAPPLNDACSQALQISVPNGGFGLGNFTSVQSDLTEATVETGESFAPAIFVAGLDKKSVWFRFRIATIRAVRVTLTQPGTTITAGDAGFTVYQSGACIPGNSAISTKLTPIVTFGNTYHPCVPAGEYLIQVSSNFNANGPIQVQVEITDQTGAAYDHPAQAYAFDTVRYFANRVDFNTECQSIEDSSEICSAFSNPYRYHKTAWLTFTTPTYFDYIVVQLSSTNGTYFPSGNGYSVPRSFGYSLYQGNAVNTTISSLTRVSGCDSLSTDGYYAAYRVYKCGDLQTATTYSIQVFIDKDFGDDIRIGILVGGRTPTRAPLPVAGSIPAPNAIGILPASPDGTQTYIDDVWGCNSRHSNYNCGPAMPDSGLLFNGTRYPLSSFFTFTLSGAAAVSFYAYVTQCGPTPITSVYRQGATATCNGLDTANLIGRFSGSSTMDCLVPGNYIVQVSGQDATSWYGQFNTNTPLYNSEQCLSSNLGTPFRLDLRAYSRKDANRFAMATAGAVDSVNVTGGIFQPLSPGVPYVTTPDTMGCQNTLLPADTSCAPVNTKAIYRQFAVGDSGVVDLSALQNPWWTSWRYRLYQGDAAGLASAQNLFAFPQRFTGMKPVSDCMDGNTQCYNKTVCVTPGTYTLVTMGGIGDVGRADRPTLTFTAVRTRYATPVTAQDMGNLWDTLGPGGGTITSDLDAWSCDDNAVPINGYQPCTVGGRPATKAIYRQFYLKQPSLVRMDVPYYWYCANRAYGFKTLFSGKVTDGLAGLTPVSGWSCFQYAAGTTAGCDLLPAGWYTVVSYNHGPSYDSTIRGINLESRYNSSVSYYDEFKITLTPTCPGPSFNRPYKASVTAGNQPHLIQPVNRNGHSPAFPRTDSTYALPTEYFNCTVDTPFTAHPVVSCNAAANRVAYYVFQTTRECYLYINTGGYAAALYDRDVRTDSLLFSSLRPLQPCTSNPGYLQYCYFQPGTYTLVIFATDAQVCQSVKPVIMAETIGYSRFDFAARAYDFGDIPPDAAYHYGKAGDVNPLNPLRKPSSDFFYCTTGADSSNPADPVCSTRLNPNVYNSGPNKPLYDSAFPPDNGPARRNLWYTFVVNHPGDVKVKVDNRHDLRGYQPRFAVYKSNVDASLPFSTVVSSGQVDSTTAQGLSLVGVNQIIYWPGYCFQTDDEVSFYRDPCSAVPTRYYVLVENVNAQPNEPGGTLPNTQIEVSVMLDSVNLVLPRFDHYYQAGNIGTAGVGTYTGETDNYSCATWDPSDPLYYYGTNPTCRKTLWYKFTSTITGNVRYRVFINGAVKYDYYDVQIFQELIPGDSTTRGLEVKGYSVYYDNSTNSVWAETCVAPGTYYLLVTGCGQLNQYVYPQIQLVENIGDFCSRAVPAAVNGPGSASASVLVNCHTIGSDYGEFGPSLTCPENGVTRQYKSSWFRMDIGGTDTLDVTTFLVENTNAASSDIKYRMMTGDCGAMQEQSCVLDALTQNTYQCLAPGQSYYIQVFTPVTKFNQAVTGNIELRLSAVVHTDTCSPLTNCLATANFLSLFDCMQDDSVKFVNYSTYGTSIRYQWQFGDGNAVSDAVSPSYLYPALPRDTSYQVKLVVENTVCGRKDSVTRSVFVPGRPYIEFGPDVSSCNGSAYTLSAASHPGASWLWSNGSTADTLRLSAPGSYTVWVQLDYNNCRSRDTVQVVISPVQAAPLRQAVICTDQALLSADRNLAGLTYRWNTGATTPTITVQQPGVYWADLQYYSCTYRDSFSVSNLTDADPLGGDTTVCLNGNGYTIRADASGAQGFRWNDNSTADTLLIQAPGTYHVTIQYNGCQVSDTVQISAFPPPLQELRDTSFCNGNSLQLPWGLQVQQAGDYRDTLRFSGGCDSLVRLYRVSVHPRPALGPDTTVCLVSPFVLNATASGAMEYRWQDGSSGNSYQVSIPGLYWVEARFATCTTRDSIRISGAAAPALLSSDTSTCYNSLRLPWGQWVNTGGVYSDTVRNNFGCDSLIRQIRVSFLLPPQTGPDTIVQTCGVIPVDLTRLFPPADVNTWTLGASLVLDPTAVTLPGNYRLVAQNNNGCADTGWVTLRQLPQPQLGADTALVACAPATVNLTSFYASPGFSSEWTNNGNPVNQPAAVSQSGNYRLRVFSPEGCADTAFLTLTVNPKPALGADRDTAVCSPANVNLLQVYVTTGLQASWDLNGNPVISPQSVSGGGQYRLIVQNNAGCADTAMYNLQVNLSPALGNDTALALCAPAVVNLTTFFAAAGLQTSWTLNGTPFNNPALANASGMYRLIAVTPEGCADTGFVSLTLHPRPVLGNDTLVQICPGNRLDLSGLYAAGNYNLAWFTGTQSIPAPFIVDNAGQYRVEAVNMFGCGDTAILTLGWFTAPVLGPDINASFCSGSSFNLDTVRATGSHTRTWTLSGLPVSNPAVVTQPGIYQLRASNLQGCSDTLLLSLTELPLPALQINNPAPLCLPQRADLTAPAITAGSSPGLIFSYWNDASALDPLLQPASAGEGRYYIKGTSVNGCSRTGEITVSNHPVPVANAGADQALCYGDSIVTLSGFAGNSPVPVTFNWEPVATGGIRDPASPVTRVQPASTPMSYILTVTDGYGCNYRVSDTVIVTRQPPVPAFAGNDTLVPAGMPYALQASGGVGYSWSPPELLSNPRVADPLAVIRADSVRFTVVVRDEKGCEGYDDVLIRTLNGITYYVPNAFTPNGDGLNDFFKPIPVGIVSTQFFRVFNRYGELLFESASVTPGWDGTYRGRPQPPANYVWVLQGTGRNGRQISLKGNVVLIR